MEGVVERECSALAGLFQQIVSDMKSVTPLWEDLVAKSTKLHSCLRATISAISAYLESFQKIADAATNARGATKEIGTALTRVCLRHKAVESRMKSFTSALLDCFVNPLQDKIEDWKKALINLDRDYARDYKRARNDLKKRSTDTLRLQKKAKKCSNSDLQRRVECSLQDISERKVILEEIEKKAVRSALIEERSRFCILVALLKPVVDEEVAVLSELSHLQEVIDQLRKHTTEPHVLPPASEQVINDTKNNPDKWVFQTPPSSPGSLGARKSSVCSISSITSSSSGSSKSHHSPNHQLRQRSLSQLSNMSEQNSHSSCDTESTANAAEGNVSSVWPNLQETLQFERAASAIINDRPSTLASAYDDKGLERSSLVVQTYHVSETNLSQCGSGVSVDTNCSAAQVNRPPVPNRCSSLERPAVPSSKSKLLNPAIQSVLQQAGLETSQPMYVNMHELANLAATKAQEKNSSSSSLDYKKSSVEEKIRLIRKEEGLNSLTNKNSECYQSIHSLVNISTFEDKNQMEGSVYGTLRSTLSRRGSVQGQKPAPPIRRTSSISIAGRASLLSCRANSESSGSLECLPPPPPFLLEGSSEPVKCQSLNDVFKKNNESHRSTALVIAAELERKAALICQSEKKACPSINPTAGSISVAETVRALTELKHTPASPVSVKRSHSLRSQSVERKPEAGFIAALSSKLATTRRFSQDSTHCAKASRVRQWIAIRTLPDPALCHDSLMDQIKRGTVLKKTRTVNDRSAPRIF